ncbi:unnamed protein product, partial [Rotaria magnacalcarata]
TFLQKFPEESRGFKLTTEQTQNILKSPILSYFKVGDKVLFHIPRIGRLNVDALKPYYEGPYIIKKITTPHKCFLIQHIKNKSVEKRADHTQLRKYKNPPHYLKINPNFKELMAPDDKIYNHPTTPIINKIVTVQEIKPISPVKITGVNKFITNLISPNEVSDSDREETESDTEEDIKLPLVPKKYKKERIPSVTYRIYNKTLSSEEELFIPTQRNQLSQFTVSKKSTNKHKSAGKPYQASTPYYEQHKNAESRDNVSTPFSDFIRPYLEINKPTHHSIEISDVTPPPNKIPIASPNKDWNFLNELSAIQINEITSNTELSTFHPFMEADKVAKQMHFENFS